MRPSLSWFLAVPALATTFAMTAACSSSGPIEPTQAVDPKFDTTADPTADSDEEYEQRVTQDAPWYAEAGSNFCPTGAVFDNGSGFCTQDGKAIGAFTQKMVADCKAAAGTGCTDAVWTIAQASKFRGKDFCPAGATIDDRTGLCVEAGIAIGPFDVGTVAECKNAGGTACETMAFDAKFIADLPSGDYSVDAAEAAKIKTQADGTCSSSNARLAGYYSTRPNYAKVRAQAAKILIPLTGSPTKNGCATFLSVAIMQSGTSLPKVQPGTEGFRDMLINKGWTKVAIADLEPGDVVVSRDRPGTLDHPDHVYMFQGWTNKGSLLGNVIDNQNFTHVRNIGPATGGFSRTPGAFGLRAPGAKCTETPTTPVDSQSGCGGKADGWWCSGENLAGAIQCSGGAQIWAMQCPFPQLCSSDDTGRTRVTGTEQSGFELTCAAGAGECKADLDCASKAGTVCINGTCKTGKR